MGRRGPKPTPTNLRLLTGNAGKRPINTDEPEPPPGEDSDWKRPSHLDGDARAEWDRLVEPLRTSGILTVADRTIFAIYCQAFGQLRSYEKLVKRHGPAISLEKGYQGQVIKLRAQVQRLSAECGLTPSSRSGIKGKAPAAKEKDSAEERFFGGGSTR